jgi:predicted MFS family arabinose efflux permease
VADAAAFSRTVAAAQQATAPAPVESVLRPGAVETTAPRPRGRQLPSAVAFGLLVSILVCFLAGSSAPTPLYATYSAEWHFSSITVTVIFGIYAIAVLASLLVFGSLSDHIGRRPVLLVAIALQTVVMVVFATADGVTALIVARVVQGLSTGAAVGALGAGLLDLNRDRGTVANGVAALAGTATGALLSGVFVQLLPDPTELVYLVLAAAFAVQWVGVAFMAETSPRKPGARGALRPDVAMPAATRGPLLVAIPTLVAIWALAGLYGSLGPALARMVSGSDSVILGGLALFVLAAFASVTVFFVRNAEPTRVALAGNVALAAGVAVSLLAVAQTSIGLFYVGGAIAGIGFGAGFQGALRTVLPLAEPHERAGVLSIVYVVCYLSMGAPAVVGGFLAVHGGVLLTAREYGYAVMVLAGLAFAGGLWRTRAARRRAAACPA